MTKKSNTKSEANPVSREGFTKYGIGPDDLVILAGHRMRLAKKFENGVVLRSANDNVSMTKAYNWREIAAFLKAGTLEVEKNHFGEKSEIARALVTAKSHDLDPEKVLRAKMVAEFVAQESDEYDWPHERCHRSDPDIERFQAIFTAENEELVEEARVSLIRKGRKHLFVGPRQFRRLVERFEEANLNPASMADRYHSGGSPGSRLENDSLAYVMGFVKTARTPNRPTIKSAWEAMDEDDADRKKTGKRRYMTVSLSTFQRMYSEGYDFQNDVGRLDALHAVERKYGFKGQGLRVTRPLQIVEMDEHKVHLMKMLVKNELWDRLAKDVQVRIEKMGRMHMSVAMDAFSRSIVGLKFLKGAPDAEAAVATLAMVAQRKDKLSALLGAQTRWPQCGTPEAVHTDAGAGYVAAKFEMAVMMFTGRQRIPPSKHPHLRGRIERLFRTLNQRYIHLFSGQTFSNPLFKGEYDAAKFAHVTDEEFADLVARLIVDCYHNTKIRSLGMTPLEAWERGSQLAKGGIAPPPSSRQYREIFGATVKRSIGNNGIEIAGNIYSSPKLLEIRKKWYRAKLWVRINEEDISKISVKHRRRNVWIDVPAVFSGLKGVTLDEWKETIRYIDRRLGTKKVHSEETVREALKAAREIIELSKQRPGILVHRSIEEKLAAIESKISLNFKYNQKQPYDYAMYDDGIDHDDIEDDDDEAAAVGRLKANLEAAPPPERYLPPIPDGGNAFNPGAGIKVFDRSGFVSDDAPERPKRAPGTASAGKSVAKSALKTGEQVSLERDAPVEAYITKPIDDAGGDVPDLPRKPRKSIRITSIRDGGEK